MIPGNTDGVLWTGAVVHGLVGLVCMLLLLTDAAPLLGVHPALKPMKFGLSIALFLGTMAVFVPTLSVAPGTPRGPPPPPAGGFARHVAPVVRG